MNQDLRDRLTRSANQLNYVSDAMNEGIEEIEDLLCQAHVGTSVWIDVKVDDERVQLGYAKVGKSWHIAVRLGDEVMPLTRTSRGLRVALALQIDRLLEVLIVRLEGLVVDVQKATERINAIASALKP